MEVAYVAPRPLSQLLRAAWSEYQRDYARYFAGAMVYYALLSLVPLALLLLAALGLLLRFSELAAAAEQELLGVVESRFSIALRATLEELLERLQQGSVVATAVSLAGLMITASALFRHLRMSFRAIWKRAPPLVSGPLGVVIRATLLERAIALAMVLVGGMLLLAALALIAAINSLTSSMSDLPLLVRVVSWFLVLASPLVVLPLTFALLFRFLPPVRLRWREVWLASLLCAAAWLLGTEVLALYGAYFGRNLSTYGAIGAVLLVMLWMNAVSQVLFYGAELCKVVARRDAAPPESGRRMHTGGTKGQSTSRMAPVRCD